MTSLQIEDFIAVYPSPHEPGFQNALSSKREFRELSSTVSESRPAPGEFYTFQRLVLRFMLAFDSLMTIWRTGTGKTRAAAAPAEHFRKDPGSFIKRAILIARGDTIIKEWQKQLICIIESPEPEPKKISKNPEADRVNLVKREMKKFYKFTTYQKFTPEFFKTFEVKEQIKIGSGNDEIIVNGGTVQIPPDPNSAGFETLRNYYAGALYIIDEGHNLAFKLSEGTHGWNPETKKFEKGLKFFLPGTNISMGSLYRVVSLKVPNTNTREYRFKAIDKKLIYIKLWMIFHYAYRIKTMILTATPMINQPEESIFLINLLSRITHQLPFDREISKMSFEDLEPYIRGYISYVREPDIGAKAKRTHTGDITENGFRIPKSIFLPSIQIPITALSMSPHQMFGPESELRIERDNLVAFSGYVKAALTDSRKSSQAGETRSGIYSNSRAAVDFVYPDGSYGRFGFAKYIEFISQEKQVTVERVVQGRTVSKTRTVKLGGIYRFKTSIDDRSKNYLDRGDIAEFIRNNGIDGIRFYSAKYAFIVEACGKLNGICFVFSEFIKGSGIIPLSLCFTAMKSPESERLNFELFTGFGLEDVSNQTFSSVGCGPGDVTVRSIAQLTKGALVKRDGSQKSPWNVAVFTSGNKRFHAIIIAIMNHPENLHGEYIKVVIGSPVMGEGVNINNVKNIILMSSGWDINSDYQAESRGLRGSIGHADLIKEEKERAIAEGRLPETVTIDVNIFRLAAVASFQPEILRWGEQVLRTGDSIDAYKLQEADAKDRKIKLVDRNLKKAAVDSQIQYMRNVRSTDVDNSQICDYQECEFLPGDPIPLFDDRVDSTRYIENLPDLERRVGSWTNLVSEIEIDRVMIDLGVRFEGDKIQVVDQIRGLIGNLKRILRLDMTSDQVLHVLSRFGANPHFKSDTRRFIRFIREATRLVRTWNETTLDEHVERMAILLGMRLSGSKLDKIQIIKNSLEDLDREVLDTDFLHQVLDKCLTVRSPGTQVIVPRYVEDQSTFDILYSDKIIERISVDIVDIFSYEFTMSLETLYQRLSRYQTKFIKIAIERLINLKNPIVNRLGFINYLRQEGTSLYLQKEIPVPGSRRYFTDYTLNTYTSMLNASEGMPLLDYSQIRQFDSDELIINGLKSLNPEDPTFVTKITNGLNQISTLKKALLLETAMYSKVMEGRTNRFQNAIIEIFSKFIFTFREPVESMELQYNKIHATVDKDGKGKRGRKPKEDTKKAAPKVNQKTGLTREGVEVKEGGPERELIYIHSLTDTGKSHTSYNISAISAKPESLRLMKPSERTGWRDAKDKDPYEFQIYNVLVQQLNHTTVKEYRDKFKIYGTVLQSDGKFRLVDTTVESTKASTDARSVKGGQVCSTINKGNLLGVIAKLGITLTGKHTNTQLCTLIYDHLESIGAIYRD